MMCNYGTRVTSIGQELNFMIFISALGVEWYYMRYVRSLGLLEQLSLRPIQCIERSAFYPTINRFNHWAFCFILSLN